MGICKRRLLVPGFCFLLQVLLYFLFSFNYSKLKSPAPPVPTTLKLILETINISVSSNDRICQGQSILILQLITSHAGNYKLRQRIRNEFNSLELTKLRIRRLFLIGQTLPNGPVAIISNGGKFRIPSEQEIRDENQASSDLIIGTFGEAYRNLTYKHLMGLLWVQKHCNQTQFVLKQDDDIYVDLYGLVNKLTSSPLGQTLQSRGGIYGKVLQNRLVERSRASKWYVTKEEFGNQMYPDYVSGWAYVTTPSTIQRLLGIVENVTFFWIDDVFVTGILRSMVGIELIDGSESFAVTKDFFECCRTVSQQRVPYWCDFIVGPPPSDDIRFQLVAHSKQCRKSGRCLRRTLKESLLKTCVITREGSIHPRKIPLEKGIAMWEPIKLAPIT